MQFKSLKRIKNGNFVKDLIKNKTVLLINLILTLVNILLVSQANNISRDSLKASEANLGFEIDKTSQEYVSSAYSSIYENQTNQEVIYAFKNNQIVGSRDKLLSLVDTLEEVGSDFCQGTAKTRHIRIYLQNTLSVVCPNEEIFKYFGGKRNGLAMLCYEFFPSSSFAKSLIKTNLSTCEFVDSNRFSKTQNRRRFEYSN
jgi:hypothetical protein